VYLRNRWYCAAVSDELGTAPLGRILLDEPVVLYRKSDGALVALEDRCCHRRAPLSKGKVEGDKLRCGYHGFLYEPGGNVVWVPGQDKVPPGARVRAYPLVEKHGFAWIWMGAPSQADPATIPDFHWNDDPEFAAVAGLLPVAADYRLLMDNLMDLSHVSFLHAATIGSPDDRSPEVLTWDRGADWVKGTRVMRDCRPSPRMQSEGVTFNIDRLQIMTYTPPANVVIDLLTTESGRKLGEKGRHNDRLVILDAMTPETETSCHYFWASCRDYRLDDPKFDEFVRDITIKTFTEDKVMLEAEQKVIDLRPEAPQIDVTGDTGGLQARRTLARLISEENARQAAE
jgi:vanillate O-demethylase monooxygenase subunit